MFEWILFGLIAAVTVAACVTIDTLRKAMTKAKISMSEIIDIDRVHNKVTLKDLESRVQIEVTGDDISNEIYRGRKIRVAIASKNEESNSFFNSDFSPEQQAIFAALEESMKNDPTLAALEALTEADIPHVNF